MDPKKPAAFHFAEGLRHLVGWRRFGAAFFFGAAGVLAFAPTGFFPVLWLSFPALIFLLQGAGNAKQAFLTGWSFAFGNLVFGLYWIAAAMFVDIRQFWWAVPLAVAGLPALFAIYYGVAAALIYRIGIRGFSGSLIFALLWFLADYARGHLFTGFPWNFEGHAWSRALPVLQITSVIGIYGLTLLTVLAASIFSAQAEENKFYRHLAISGMALFILIAVWGEWRLSQDANATVSDVWLRVVQPNTDQAHKWATEERENNLQKLLDLSTAPGQRLPTHVIWPETAAPFYLMEDPIHRRMVGAHAPQNGSILTGVIRRDPDGDGNARYYNSLVAIDNKAQVIAGYDKFHLVPYGEYIPLRSLLPLRTLTNLGLDFSSGNGPRSLRVPGLPPFSPLICYEVIFSGEVEDRSDRPGFLVNVTNDGWYGNTAGPYQHFANARLRAIEEGLPLVRSANTGISGVIDAYGRIIARIGLGKSDFVDVALPAAIEPTFFSRYHEMLLWIIFAALVLGSVYLRTNKET